MFRNLSVTGIIGIIMQAIAGIGMGTLVLLDKPIPDLIAWVFFIGLIVALVPDLLIGERNGKKSKHKDSINC